LNFKIWNPFKKFSTTCRLCCVQT